MYPDQPSPSANQPLNSPLFNAPFSGGPNGPVSIPGGPVVNGQVPSPNNPVPKKSKLVPVLLIGGAVVLLVIIAVIVVLGSSKKKPETNTAATATTDQSQALDIATPTNIQLLNDSISQDISGVNDEQDFPADQLDDKTLGL